MPWGAQTAPNFGFATDLTGWGGGGVWLGTDGKSANGCSRMAAALAGPNTVISMQAQDSAYQQALAGQTKSWRGAAWVKLESTTAGTVRAKVTARLVNSSNGYVADVVLATVPLTVGTWLRVDGSATVASLTSAYPTATGVQTKVQCVNDAGDGTAGYISVLVDEIVGQFGDASQPSVAQYLSGDGDERSNRIPRPSGVLATGSTWGAYWGNGSVNNYVANIADGPPGGPSTCGSIDGAPTNGTALCTAQVGDPASGNKTPATMDSHGYRRIPDGSAYSGAVWVKPMGVALTSVKCRAYFRDGNGNWLGSIITTSTTAAADTWTRLTFSVTPPAGTEWAMFWVQADGLTNGQSYTFRFTGWIDAASASVPSYFDGSTAGARWSGTANASASFMTMASRSTSAARAVAQYLPGDGDERSQRFLNPQGGSVGSPPPVGRWGTAGVVALTTVDISADTPVPGVTQGVRASGTTGADVWFGPAAFAGGTTRAPSGLFAEGKRPVTPGQTYSGSFWLKTESISGTWTPVVRAYSWNDNGGWITDQSVSSFTLAAVGQWTKVSWSWTAPGGAAFITFAVRLICSASGSYSLVMAAPIDATGTAGDYFDGSTPGARTSDGMAFMPTVARSTSVSRSLLEQPSARNIWPNETFEGDTIGNAPAGITPSSGGGANGTARINQVVGAPLAVEGSRSWRLAFTTNGAAQVTEAGWMSTVTPVKPGDRVSATLKGRVDSTVTSPYNTLVVQYVWRDASGATILNNYPGTSPAVGAFTYSTIATAPANAASVLMAVFIQQAGPTFPLPAGTLDMTLDSIVVAREPDVLSRAVAVTRTDPTWVGGVPVENATVAKKALLIWRTGGNSALMQGWLESAGWTVDAVMSSTAPPATERDGWRTQATTGGYSLVCFDWRVWSATPVLDLAYELYNVYGLSVLTTGNDTTSSAGCPIWTGTSNFQTNFGTLINTTGRENHPLGARWPSTFNDTDIKNSFASPRASATVWAHAIDTERGGIQVPMALAESAGLNGAKFVHVQPSPQFWPSWLGPQVFGWIAPDRGIGRQAGLARGAQDALPISDQPSRAAVCARATLDALSFADAAARLFAGARGAADTLALSDTPTRSTATSRQVTDVLALSLAASRSLAVARQASEELGWQDALTVVQDLHRFVTEQFVLADVVRLLRAGPQNVEMDVQLAYLATLAVAAAYDAALHDSPAFTAELKVT